MIIATLTVCVCLTSGKGNGLGLLPGCQRKCMFNLRKEKWIVIIARLSQHVEKVQ